MSDLRGNPNSARSLYHPIIRHVWRLGSEVIASFFHSLRIKPLQLYTGSIY